MILPNLDQKCPRKLSCLWQGMLRQNDEAAPNPRKLYLITGTQAESRNCSYSVRYHTEKRVESVQQQLGADITALNRGLELLLNDDLNKPQAIKHLSESCSLLCDLHHVETTARKKLATNHPANASFNKPAMKPGKLVRPSSVHLVKQRGPTGGAEHSPSGPSASSSNRSAEVFESVETACSLLSTIKGKIYIFCNCWLNITNNPVILQWVPEGYTLPLCCT